MAYQGIDYGLGLSNVDKDTGIRYGVISERSLGEWINDVIADGADYGQPTCPKCSNDADVVELSDITDESPCSCDDHGANCVKHSDMGEWPRYSQDECDDFACMSCAVVFGSESAYSE